MCYIVFGKPCLLHAKGEEVEGILAATTRDEKGRSPAPVMPENNLV